MHELNGLLDINNIPETITASKIDEYKLKELEITQNSSQLVIRNELRINSNKLILVIE